MFSCPFSACHWRRSSAHVHQISFKAGVRRCPFEWRCTVMFRSSLMRHDMIVSICLALRTWSCFQSGFRRVCSRTFLIAALALMLFRHPDQALSSTPQSSLCLIAQYTKFHQIFSGFKSLKILESDFPHLWRTVRATWFPLKPHSMLTLQEMWANCPGTSTWRVNSPKITNLWTLPPHCLQTWTTWILGHNLWEDYVFQDSELHTHWIVV